jgi:hypothetical protein
MPCDKGVHKVGLARVSSAVLGLGAKAGRALVPECSEFREKRCPRVLIGIPCSLAPGYLLPYGSVPVTRTLGI